MIKGKIYRYNELKEAINKIKFSQKPLFRGEASYHKTCLPSISRLAQDKRSSYFNVMVNLSLFIAQKKIFPRLEHKVGYVLYNGLPFGANCIINPVDCEPRHVSWGVQGLLQHYGFPTWWMDFTFNLDTAIYFATQKSDSEIGYLYYLDEYDTRLGNLIDLELFSNDLRKILKLPSIRPERQKALAFRFREYEIFDVRKILRVVKFKKPEFTQDLDEYYFPKDALRTWLMGQLTDYYYDLMKNENYLKESESFQASYREQKVVIEGIMTDLGLW